MAVSFLSIQADVESQLNALIATTPTIAETAYSAVVAGTSTVADRTSTDWGLLQIQNAILDTEYDLIKEVCFNGRHPERGTFSAVSGTLANRADLPSFSAGGASFLGEFSYCRENGTNTPLRERELQIVQWATANSSSVFSNPRVLVYAIAGGTLFHNSTTTVFLQGAAADRATVSGTTYSPVNIRLRDYHRPAIVAGSLVRLLAKEGQWAEAFEENGKLYTAHVEQIRNVGKAVAEPYTAR